jgi:putative aldouronate transport system permease protein
MNAEGVVNRKSAVPQAILNIVFAMYTIVCVFPLLLVFAVSFSDENTVTRSGYKIIPQAISTKAYEFILSNGVQILEGYWLTILSTVVGTTLSLLITASLAYPISRRDFKHRNKFAFYVYFTMLFNGGMIPLYLVYTQMIPLKNSIACLIIPNMISAFHVLLMRTNFAQNIPDSVVESAEIDGASVYRIFFTIVLPLSTPVLASIGLLTAISYWNDYFRNMLFVNDDSIANLQYLLYRIQQQVQFMNANPNAAQRIIESGSSLPNETARMAMVILAIGPIIFAYPFVQKYFVKGLTVGAVKG